MMGAMHEKPATRVSVIVVNYNGADIIGACLASIRAYVDAVDEIVVVDNASTDASVAAIRSSAPDATLLLSNSNLGFSGGNNLGVCASTGEFVLLLNSDARLTGPLEPAIDVLRSDPMIGVVGARLIFEDGQPQPSVGREHSPLRLLASWIPGLASSACAQRLLSVESAIYRAPLRDVDFVTGAFLFTRRALWDELGGLDEGMFMYLEDVDFCRRVRGARWRVVYSNRVTAIHLEGAGRPWVGTRALCDTANSTWRLLEKHQGWRVARATTAALALIFALRSGAHWVIGILRRSAVDKDKARGYLRASGVLLCRPMDRKAWA